MTPKVLSILIIGGEASSELGAASMSGHQGYLPRLLQLLQRAGWQLQTECHAPVDVDMALPLLQRLNLNRFDLILLELGHSRLKDPALFSHLLQNESGRTSVNMADIASRSSQNGLQQANWGVGHTVRSWVELGTLWTFNLLNQVGRLREVDTQLVDLLFYLHPHRRRLVLMTPFPHPDPVIHWLRMKGRQLFWKHGRRHMIPVFDTAAVLGTGEEYFSNKQYGELSPVAGDVLGQMLFEYLQINALLPARPEMRQRRRY